MKTSILLIFLSLTFNISAQTYDFEMETNVPYVELSNSNGHLAHPFNGQVYEVVLAGGPYGNFNAFGKTFDLDNDVVRVNVNGNIDFVSDDYFAIFDGVMLPLRSIDATSRISYHHINDGISHKLVFQWKNCGFDGDTDNWYINFQLHFDFISGDFWTHYGPTNNTTGEPKNGLALANNNLTQLYETIFLINNPTNPTVSHNTGFDFLNAPPAEGVVYKWKNNVFDIEEHTSFVVELYPNPAKDILHLSFSNQTSIQSIQITDLLGKLVLTSTDVDLASNAIDISHLSTGTYLLSASTTDGQVVNYKFLKQ
ncbi:MAG: T9SS type A sorting domain-containing protein [Salibacteraceae bacterium]